MRLRPGVQRSGTSIFGQPSGGDSLRRPKSRFTPSLPNIRDTLKLSKNSTRRKSVQVVPDIVESADEPSHHHDSNYLSDHDQASLDDDLAGFGMRPPGSPDPSAVQSVRSTRSRFVPSLQNIKELTGPALRFRSRSRNSATQPSAEAQVPMQAVEEAGEGKSPTALERFEALFPRNDRGATGERPSSAPGQMQEPTIDILAREATQIAGIRPVMMDSATQTELAPVPAREAESEPDPGSGPQSQPESEPPPAAQPEAEPTRGLDPITPHTPARTLDESLTDDEPGPETPPAAAPLAQQLLDYNLTASDAKRAVSLPLMMHPGAYDHDSDSYFVPSPRARRSSESLDYGRPARIRTSHDLPEDTAATMSPTTAWKTLHKANMAAKRQRHPSAGLPASTNQVQPALQAAPVANQSGVDVVTKVSLQDASTPHPPADQLTPASSQPPFPPTLGYSAQPINQLSTTLFAESELSERPTMSTGAGIAAAIVGAVAGAVTVASRFTSKTGAAASSTPMLGLEDFGPFSGVNLDTRRVRQQHTLACSTTLQPNLTHSPPSASQSLLQAAQSDDTWQEHWGIYTHEELALQQDTDFYGCDFDEELAALQPNRPPQRRHNSDGATDRAASPLLQDESLPVLTTPDLGAQDVSVQVDTMKPAGSPALERLSAILRQLNPTRV
ncbi:hypothetical protein KEM52_005712 [Ascosphaera acerosa]|nr:hypothetical protein KEM52_005712 [Ascosphaera acerosa]